MRPFLIVGLFIFLFQLNSFSQNTIDTALVVESKSPGALSVLFKGKPGKAFVYSILLPGAGQVYNKRIWKVPLIYACLGGLLYAVHFNSTEFKRFDSAYRMRVDTDRLDEPDIDEFKNILSLQGINSHRQFYDKNLQLSYIGIGVVYLLNAIEAFVDRHLQDFDVSDNLSFKYIPNYQYSAGAFSIVYSF